MSIVAGSLQLGGGTTAEITAAAAVVPLVRQVIVNRQTGQYYIGDGTTALGSLTAYGGASGLTVGTTTITSGTNTRILYNNAGVVGEYLVTGTGTTAVLSTSPTFNTSVILNVGNVAASTSGMTITNTNTSGYGTSLYFRGTNGSTYDYCAIQSENSSTGGLIRFQTANTSQVMTTRAEINSAGNMSVGFSVPFANLQVGRASADSATAPTTIGTSYYFGVGRAEYTANSYRLIGLGYNTSTTTTFPAFIGYQEISVSGKSNGDLIFGTRSVTTDTDPSIVLRLNTLGSFIHTPSVSSSGAATNFTVTTSANTNQTLSTNIPNFKVTGSSKQWATGALATQYFNYFSANTVSFAGASTATNVYGLYVEAATAGTNATITNNYAAGFSGNVNIIGTPYVSGVAGVDGSFTTVDGKTVTVSKGLITAIV